MIKAILLVLDPGRTWDRIVADNRSYLSVLVSFLLPLLAITCAAEGTAIASWGKRITQLKTPRTFTVHEVVWYEVFQGMLGLALVFFGARVVKNIGETFHGRHTFDQAFRTVAYGLSPLFLVRLLDISPNLSPWVSWSIGMALSIAVLYHGVPRAMQPDPPQAFGLFLVSAIVLTMAAAAVRFVTGWMLAGRLKELNELLLDMARRVGI